MRCENLMTIDTLGNGINIIIDLTVMDLLCMVIGYMNAILIKENYMGLVEEFAMSILPTLGFSRMANGKVTEFTQAQLLGITKEHGKKVIRRDSE